MEVIKEAFANHPVGIILAIGFCVLVWFIGIGFMMNGWPKFGRK